MRRLLVGCIALALLSSCAEKSLLPPEDVLKKAAVQSGLLQSVVFDVTADLDGTFQQATGLRGNGRLTVHGTTQNGGRMTQAAVLLAGNVTGPTDHAASIDVEMIAEQGGGTYFFLRDVSVEPPHPLLPVDALKTFMGQWWQMPRAGQLPGASPVSVSPDPGLLLAQSQVIRVTKDNGIRRIRGRRAYVYDIAVDPVKLMAYLKKEAAAKGQQFDETAVTADIGRYSAKGELWVDAESFYIQQVTWDIRRKDDAVETFRARVTVDFSQHDGAPAITLPAGAKTFGSADMLKDASGQDTLLPDPGSLALPEEDPTLLDMFRVQPQSSPVPAQP